jgi:hypothetical protein
MHNVIDLWEWKRARLGGREENTPIHRRARPSRRREENSGFVRIGEVSADIVRRLR